VRGFWLTLRGLLSREAGRRLLQSGSQIDELNKGHIGGITNPWIQFENPKVAAWTVKTTRPDRIEKATNSFAITDT
jgi:hypothetical protein